MTKFLLILAPMLAALSVFIEGAYWLTLIAWVVLGIAWFKAARVIRGNKDD